MSYYRSRSYHASRFDGYENTKQKLIAAGMSLALVAGLVFGVSWLNSESKEDVARKPDLVNILRQRGRLCRINDDDNAELPQDARLTLTLEETDSDALDVLIAQDVTVCPDARLSEQKHGIFDTKLRGVFDPASKTATIYDNGNDYGDFWGNGIGFRGSELLEDLAHELDVAKLPTHPLYGSLSGKHSNPSWDEAGGIFGFDQSTLAKNPNLLVPPRVDVAPDPGPWR